MTDNVHLSVTSTSEKKPVETVPALPEPAVLTALAAQARDYIDQAKSANTRRAYRSDWQEFVTWCEGQPLAALPADPQTVALYLTARAAVYQTSTLCRRLASISQAHQAAGLPTPTTAAVVRATWQGIRRAKGVAGAGKAPAVVAELRRMVERLPDNLLGKRDRALLLVGFAGAFRRSELVALDVADLAFMPEGLVVTLRRSKTDQEGAGRKVGIPFGSHPETCPVRNLTSWLDSAGIITGPLFRAVNRHGQLGPRRLTDRTVARVVQRCAQAAGLDPRQYAGHSLRAGLATSAAAAGASEHSIMAQTGHRSAAMVRRYIRDTNLFRENAAATVGLQVRETAPASRRRGKAHGPLQRR